jgi:hypothetical protein
MWVATRDALQEFRPHPGWLYDVEAYNETGDSSPSDALKSP